MVPSKGLGLVVGGSAQLRGCMSRQAEGEEESTMGSEETPGYWGKSEMRRKQEGLTFSWVGRVREIYVKVKLLIFGLGETKTKTSSGLNIFLPRFSKTQVIFFQNHFVTGRVLYLSRQSSCGHERYSL